MSSPRRSELLMFLAMVGIAGGLVAAPARIQDRVRLTLRDAAAPAQKLARLGAESARRKLAEWRAAPDRDWSAVEEELSDARRTIRRLEAALAAANEESGAAQRLGPSPWRGETGTPLVVDELLSATVLGAENSDLVRRGKLLDAGSAGGVGESSLVLDDPRPLVDQGERSGLAAGQSVFAGRCIVGRIARVGRWVSAVQPVADPEFRGLARIIRGQGETAVYGAEGLLEGTGDGHCRLRHVPGTEAVSEGDAVYSSGGDAASPAPMFYGTVTKAELAVGASHWEIAVRPAVEWHDVKTVQVLRRKVNPQRILAQ